MSESRITDPDFDRSNQGSLQGIIAQALKAFQRGLDNCLPATVISYDRDKNIASVQPQIQMVAVDGTLINRASSASVPVYAAGGGGFVINFPLVAGSKGWIKASDRDISLYLQSGNRTAPNTARMHSFENGCFWPDFGSNFTIAGEDSASCVIQSQDGSIKISLWPTKIKLTVGSNTFEVTESELSAVVGSNSLTMNATGLSAVIGSTLFDINSTGVDLTGQLNIIGGPITVNGTIVIVP